MTPASALCLPARPSRSTPVLGDSWCSGAGRTTHGYPAIAAVKATEGIEEKSQGNGLWTTRPVRDQGKEAKTDPDTPSGRQQCPY